MDPVLIFWLSICGFGFALVVVGNLIGYDNEAGGDFPVMYLPQSPKRAITDKSLRNERRTRAMWLGRTWIDSQPLKLLPQEKALKGLIREDSVNYAKQLCAAYKVKEPRAAPYTYHEPVPIEDFRLNPFERMLKYGIAYQMDALKGEVHMRLGGTEMIVPSGLTSSEWSIKIDQLKARESQRIAAEIKKAEAALRLIEKFECLSGHERFKQYETELNKRRA